MRFLRGADDAYIAIVVYQAWRLTCIHRMRLCIYNHKRGLGIWQSRSLRFRGSLPGYLRETLEGGYCQGILARTLLAMVLTLC